jgi:hypothetical protein
MARMVSCAHAPISGSAKERKDRFGYLRTREYEHKQCVRERQLHSIVL